MRLTPTFAALFAVLSFSSVSTATHHVIRVPLERKSVITHRSHHSSRDVTTGADNAPGHADISFLKTHLAHVAAKYRITFDAYQSNTGSPHPLAQIIATTITEVSEGVIGAALSAGKRRRMSRHTKRDDISLSEVNSNMWIGAISVGSPQQNFIVDFDTGSADLILPAEACDNTCDGHTRYNSTASSTSVNLGQPFQLMYRDGSYVNGSQIADSVYMGGYKATNQTFGAATTYSSQFKSPTFRPDGVLGLGFPSISTLDTSPVFQTMVSHQVLPQPVFGLALSSVFGKSELTIGGTNTDMYQNSTTEYIGISVPAYWQIPLAGLTRPGLNNTPDVVVVNKTSYAQALLDSGTTLIVTSDSDAQAFYANVPGAKPSTEVGGGAWSVPCDTLGLLAPTLTFGSRNFTVSPATFNLGQVFPGSMDCIAGLAGGGSAYWIIGDVFLQNVYTIFDVGNTRVGFADLA